MKNNNAPLVLIIISTIETILVPAFGFLPLLLCLLYPNVPGEKQETMKKWIIAIIALDLALFVAALSYIIYTT